MCDDSDTCMYNAIIEPAFYEIYITLSMFSSLTIMDLNGCEKIYHKSQYNN